MYMGNHVTMWLGDHDVGTAGDASKDQYVHACTHKQHRYSACNVFSTYACNVFTLDTLETGGSVLITESGVLTSEAALHHFYSFLPTLSTNTHNVCH